MSLRSMIRAVLCAVALAFLLWAGGCLVFVGLIVSAKPRDPETRTEAIIVLTGGSERIGAGFDLLAAGRGDYLLISGVDHRVVLADLLVRWSVQSFVSELPEQMVCCITLGRTAGNTRANAIESRDWLAEKGFSQARIVTSHYHIFRAMLEFRTLMPDVAFFPHPVISSDLSPWTGSFWRLALSEYHKFLLVWINLRVLPRDLLPDFAVFQETGDDAGRVHGK